MQGIHNEKVFLSSIKSLQLVGSGSDEETTMLKKPLLLKQLLLSPKILEILKTLNDYACNKKVSNKERLVYAKDCIDMALVCRLANINFPSENTAFVKACQTVWNNMFNTEYFPSNMNATEKNILNTVISDASSYICNR